MEAHGSQTQKFWRPVGNHAQLVFQEGALQTNLYDQIEGKNYQQLNVKEYQANELQDQEAYLASQGPSRQIIEFQENEPSNNLIQASIKEQNFILDETSNVYLTTSRSIIPEISITINESMLKKSTDEQKQQECSTIIEVMLCEKSSCPQRQKFKIIKGAITGCSRKKVTQKNKIQFKNLKFNYNSNPDKNSKLLIALYKINKQRIRTYVQILVSRDIFLIEDGKAIIIDTYESLFQFFENFTVDFMERPPSMVKINKQDKHTYHQEISTFQKYLIKKNKKVSHIVYLAFKFPHFVELYFRNPQKSAENPTQQKNLYALLSNSLKQILHEINLGNYSQGEKQLVCNHFNPEAKIILSINANMRRVRFLMRKQFTKLISIIASQEQPDYSNYEKFFSNKQLKEFYIQYYTNAIRCKPPSVDGLPKAHPTTTQVPNVIVPSSNVISSHENLTADKKHFRKAADQDYHQDQQQEVVEGQSDDSENYSLSQKKVRKNAKKSDIRKHQQHYTNVNSKEIKYPTRNKTRQIQNDDEDQNKKGILNRKNKEKQLLQQQQHQQQQQQQQIKKPGQPGMPGFIMGGLPGNMPFQIVNPQNPQMPGMGMFPMMQGMQGLQLPGMNMQNPANKQTNPNQPKPNPMQFNPQIMGMMPNMLGMQGGLPPQMAGLMGQPMGMFNPAALLQQQQQQQQQKKQTGSKESKDDQQNPMMKPQMPGMIPMGLNPNMFGMQGLPPGMNPFGQGMMPGMTPVAIQGPNGAMMVMMPNFMPQGQGQNPSGPQNPGGNPLGQMSGMMMPPGLGLPPGLNPFVMGLGQMNQGQSNPNQSDKNQTSQGIQPQNPLLMGMPQPMMNQLMLNQLTLQQNKAFLQKMDKRQPGLLNPQLSAQQQGLNKGPASQFNPLQQKTPTNKVQSGKKDDKPQGTFPPQNIPGLGGLGAFGQMPNPQNMMMFPPPGLSNPNLMQMMQASGFGAPKDKNQQEKQQGVNPQNIGQNPVLGMGFGSMLGGSNPGGITPQMLQQLAQTAGGPQMMPMGMLPPGFGLPGAQTQNPNAMGQQNQGQQGSSGLPGMNQMMMPGGGLGQISGQNFNPNDMMRQQQMMQQMMRKNGMFMSGMQGMQGMQGMGGMGGMFMPPKKDDEDKK